MCLSLSLKFYPEIKHHCPETPFFLVGTELETRDDPVKVEWLKKIGSSPITYNEVN